MKNKVIIIVISVIFVLLMIFTSIFVNRYGNYMSENFEISGEKIFGEGIKIQENEEKDLENENIDSINLNRNEEVNKEMNILQITNESFEEEVLKSEKVVLVDFYADWCGPCKIMAPVLEKIASENSNVKVVKVNIDNEENLAIKYRVMSIPTFVVIKNGEEVNRVIGVVSKSELEEIINS